MNITFYEKPGCAGNAKQKKLLDLHGIQYETKSILATPWSEDELNSFFEGVPKEEIFNPFAPQVKSGELNVASLSKEELVSLMIEEPILIKRPLISIGEDKICGFDIEKINALLSKDISASSSISTCQSSDPCKTI